MGSSLSFVGDGTYTKDIEQGRFHVHVGQNAGIVKTLSLSKSDQQYIREARFFQNGIDGLLQLSAVYVANIEMFGNTLFYPGMEFFFNPYGIGGPGFDPTEGGSDANKLGIGGYHTITSVKSSISPGKFTTSIAAQQYYSGDGSGNPNTVKKKNADKEAAGDITDYAPENGDDGFADCNQVILDAQNYAFEEGTLAGRLGESKSASGTAPVETASGDETEETPTTEAVTTEPVEDPEGESDNTNATATNEELGESVDTNPSSSSESSTEQESDTVVITAESQSAPVTVRRSYQGKLVTTRDVTVRSSATSYRVETRVTEVGGMFTEMTDGTVYFRQQNTTGPGPKIEITDHSRISKR